MPNLRVYGHPSPSAVRAGDFQSLFREASTCGKPFFIKKIKLTKFCKNIFSNEKYRRTFLQKFFVKKYFQNFCEEKEKLNEK
jgi:hypothetical protein